MAEEHTEPPARLSQVKRLIRRRLRRQAIPEHYGLNIYPMMDMMTILLVFMVMQFATSTAAVVQQSPELEIPYSVSHTEIDEAVALQIARNGITVDGKGALDLRNGLVDPSLKRGGATGFLITPLYHRLCEARDVKKLIAAKNPSLPFNGRIQVIADRR